MKSLTKVGEPSRRLRNVFLAVFCIGMAGLPTLAPADLRRVYESITIPGASALALVQAYKAMPEAGSPF